MPSRAKKPIMHKESSVVVVDDYAYARRDTVISSTSDLLDNGVYVIFLRT